MFGTSMRNHAPILTDGFCHLPIAERADWREALPRHLIGKMQLPDGGAIPDWKIEEQIAPVMLTIAVLLERGITDVQGIEKYFESKESRCFYATGE